MKKHSTQGWRKIPEFPAYMINKDWEIREAATGDLIKGSGGAANMVHLTKAGKQYHRGVRQLFYTAFPESKSK